MKKIFLFLALASIGFAEQIVLDNETSYPSNRSKIAVQWATSAKEVQENNHASLHGLKMKGNMQVLKQSGKIDLKVPKKAGYFRVLVWSKGEGDPDFVTNWIDIEPNKTYTLTDDYLTPTVLMSGMGC